MGVNFDQADESVHQTAQSILNEHHPKLKDLDGLPIRLCILMASQGDTEKNDPPVKLHGYPCAAIVSLIPYKQRVDKRADAEIIIDSKRWEGMSEIERRALLDHEITHLEIQVDDLGFVETDDAGRPKLKIRLHDWQLGGFRSIAQRYGADAPEVQLAREFERDHGDCALTGNKLFA